MNLSNDLCNDLSIDKELYCGTIVEKNTINLSKD
jgi:hypothetical protein